MLRNSGFIQINRGMIANAHHIVSVKAEFSGKLLLFARTQKPGLSFPASILNHSANILKLMGIYEMESRNHITANAVHFACTLFLALSCSWILGYGDGSSALLLARMLPNVIGVYAAIQLLMFLIRRFTVQNLNDKLSQK